MQFVLVVLTLVVASACGGPAAPAGTPHKSAAPAVSSDLLAFMPADSDMLLEVDFVALRRSPLWAKYKDQISELLLPGFGGCGYDPLAAVTRVTAGVPMSSRLGVFVVRGLDRDRTMACLRTSREQTDTSVSFDGDIVTLTNKSGTVNMFTFVDRTTLVMQGSTGPTKASLQEATRIGVPLRGNPGIALVEKQLPPGYALGLLMPPGSRTLASVAARIGGEPRHVWAAVVVTDKVVWTSGLTFADTEAATDVGDQLRAMFEQASGFVERTDVRIDGATVISEVVINEQQIATLAALAQSQMKN